LFENGQTTKRTVESARSVAMALGFDAQVDIRWGEVLVRTDGVEAGSQGRIIAAAPLGVDMGKVAATLDTIEKLGRGELDAQATQTALTAVAHRPASSDSHFVALPPGVVAEQIVSLLALAGGSIATHSLRPAPLADQLLRLLRDRYHEIGLTPTAVARDLGPRQLSAQITATKRLI
jgi:uncharacterized membrane protein YjjP (DUF1212 family)